MEKERVYKLLDNIKNNVVCDYDIETSFNDFYKYLDLGRTKKECLQIFMMCYVVNLKVEELTTWSLQDLLDYIKETDEYYKQDKKYIDRCVKIIESRKEEQ